MYYRSSEVRAFRLALAGMFAVTVPIAVQANGPGSTIRAVTAGPPPGIVLARDGGRAGRQVGAVGDHPTAGHVRQWNDGWVSSHWGPHRQHVGWGPYGWQGVPTYWVWVPGSAVFDYPFSDWRGPTGGWGNP